MSCIIVIQSNCARTRTSSDFGTFFFQFKDVQRDYQNTTDVCFNPKKKRNPITLSCLPQQGLQVFWSAGYVLKITVDLLIVIEVIMRKSNGIYYVLGITITGSARPTISITSPHIKPTIFKSFGYRKRKLKFYERYILGKQYEI